MNIRRWLCAARDRVSSDRTPRNSSPIVEALESRLHLNADWTILVYVDGDNNLESFAIDDINEMEMVGSSSNVNIVVQCDRALGYDTSNGDWTDTQRALISRDYNTSAISSDFESIGEQDMGDKNTLLEFLEWGVTTYTADHYAVILWDHGGGIDGVCWDDSSLNDYLTINDLDWTFGQLEQTLGFSGFDIIGFDACLMGMTEVAYEMAPYADYMVASEDYEPGDGWAYNEFLAAFSNPNLSTADITEQIVSSYVDSYTYTGVTLSSIDLNSMTAPNGGLIAELDNFIIETVTNATTNDYNLIQEHWSNTYAFDYDALFSDLGEFLGYLALDTNLTESIRDSALDALLAYTQAVSSNDANYTGPTGLSIYFPSTGLDSAYLHSGLDFVTDTQWDVFLDWFEDMQCSGFPGKVEGYVYEDVNVDGVLQSGETNPLAGCKVYLGGRVAITDSRGYYCFNSVQTGNYTLEIRSGNDIWGTTLSQTITVAPNQTIQAADLGAAYAGVISGTAYERDGGGIVPAVEWTIYIDANNNGIFDTGELFAVTDANGTYELYVQPGTEHIVCAVLKEGYRSETPAGGEYVILPLDSDETSAGNDFTFQEWLYAYNQEFTATEDQTLTGGQLDPAADPMNYGSIEYPIEYRLVGDLDGDGTVVGTNGTLTLNPDGSFTYTPNENYNGEDSFGYYCLTTDPAHADYISDPAYVIFTVTPVNDAPYLKADPNDPDDPAPEAYDPANTELVLEYNVNEEDALVLDLSQYFWDYEAYDEYGVTGSNYLRFVTGTDSSPQYGTFKGSADDGMYTYTYQSTNPPCIDADGDDVYDLVTETFRVYALDMGDPLGADNALMSEYYLTININITPVNDAPTCENQSLTMEYDGTPTQILLLGHDEETYNGALEYTLVSDPYFIDSNGNKISLAGRVDIQGNRATFYFAQQRMLTEQTIQFTYSVSEPGETPNKASSQATVELTLTPPEGINVSVASGQTVQYYDEDGSVVQLRITNGNALLFFAGSSISAVYSRNNVIEITGGQTWLFDMQLVKSSQRTAVTVTARGGDGRATIGAIQGEGVLGKFNGQCVDLIGLGVNMTGNGYIGNLQLNSVQCGADITMEGYSNALIMSLGTIDTGSNILLGNEESEIYSSLKSFTATYWNGEGSLTADSIGTFRITGARGVAGNIYADITLYSGGVSMKNANVSGEVGGDWEFLGAVQKLYLATTSDTWNLEAGGSIGQIRSKGTITGNIMTDAVIRLIQAGNLNDATIHAGGGIHRIQTGSLDGTTIDAGGSINRIQASSWESGSLEATWVRTLRITGTRGNRAAGVLGADITLTGQWRDRSLYSAYVAGQVVGGTWDLAGSLQTFNALGGTAAAWTADIDGSIGSLLSRGTLDGNLQTGGTVGLLRTTGTLAADIAVNGVASGLSIKRLQAGRVENASLTAQGGVGRLQAGEWLEGQIRASYINTLQTYRRRGTSGNFRTDLTLTGQNHRGLALQLAKIAGDWDVNLTNAGPGNIGRVYENGKPINV